MILDIDVGNSRVKWLLKNSRDQAVDRGQFYHRERPFQTDAFGMITTVNRVRMVSVERDIAAKISRMSKSLWGVSVEIARVADGSAGVTCGYDYPEKLGVDRWLAVVAGWCRLKKAFIVVDAGSALTIDVVNGHGIHNGGYILPGFEMMKKSLETNTWGVLAEGLSSPDNNPARHTDGAVANGCLAGAVGAVEHIVRCMGVDQLLLTGGDAELIQQYLHVDAEVTVIPDLVLEGLSIVVP